MKKIYASCICILLVLMALNIYSDALNIGYREFTLGQSRDEIKKIISAKYSGANAKYLANGDVQLNLDEMIKSNLYLDHKSSLYKINVQMKYGDITEIKKRLVNKYGQPNDFTNEEWDGANKLYLVARWLVEKRYSICLWESYYCRNERFMPCMVEVDYIDLQRKEIKKSHERGLKEGEKKDKLDKTYDGF